MNEGILYKRKAEKKIAKLELKPVDETKKDA